MKSGFPLRHTLRILPVTAIAFVPLDVHGACALTPTPGNDAYVCDSGSSGALSDSAGDNSLIFPVGGTGSVTGTVSFGAGRDRVDMASGSVTGNVSLGDGADSFVFTGGAISGDVSQGSGIDSFEMSGGSLRSLFQGDGLDRFSMSAGTISNAFEDGDNATMTGGTIGRVDMKLDDNLFDLSGGRIIGNLVTGFGRDTIIVRGGSIGGNVSVSGGDDQISVSGGEINGEIRSSFGNDRFTWRDGGVIRSNVLLAEGDDTALLENLDEARLSATSFIDAGPGVDQLAFSATQSAAASRYSGWEQISLANTSQLDLAAPLTLGDSASGSGTLLIDASSRVTSTSGSVVPYLAGQRVTVRNSGTLDMTTGSAVTGDTLRIVGDYIGDNGRLLLQSTLADDASPSDRLIVAQGTISGATQLAVTNTAGPGGLTRTNGIEVVQATEGATSDNSAFSLADSVSAGPYQYYLFKGGLTAGSENSWFLRSAVLSPRSARALPPEPPATPPDPAAEPAPAPAPQPEPAPAVSLPVPAVGTPALPVAAFDAAPVVLYRVEVPTYSVVVPAAAILTMASIGTFHERQGDQSLLSETGSVPAGWARVLGDDFRQQWSGDAAPTLDATLNGYQIGHDLYAGRSASGHIHRGGLFVAHSRLKGHVDGFAEGINGKRSGKLDVDGDSVGAYWTVIAQSGAYLDGVLMGTRIEGDTRSERGLRTDVEGQAFTASIEAGYPLAVSADWVLEPQAQLIHQRIDLDSQNDGISHLSFDAEPRNTARIGARLKGRYPVRGMVVEPWVRTNLWRTFGGEDEVRFDHAERIDTQHSATRADIGAGVTARVSKEVSVYASGDWSQNLDAHDYRGLRGSLGVRVKW